MRTPVINFDEASGKAGQPKQEIDALLVASLPNIEYITGFDGSNALLLIERSGELTLFTDPRYTIHAGRVFPGKVVTVKNKVSLAQSALKRALKRKHKKIGFERLHLTYAEYQAIAENLPLGVELVPTGGDIEKQRMVKDGQELAHIRRAINTNSAAFDAAIKKVKAGMSETDLAAEIDYQQRRRGASGTAFDTIVAFGERTALPHAHPGSFKLVNDAIILIDVGARQDGYTSDMTRMLSFGKISNRLKELYQAVLESQLASIDAIREGVLAQKIDLAARTVLKTQGLDKQFVHSTGHGLGLEIHEAPSLRKKDKTPLAAGMVITVEPGVYVEGVGGIRIEDTVLVTKTGCEILTPTRKELIQL
jgi:Xaa-Pro aminopeptidase